MTGLRIFRLVGEWPGTKNRYGVPGPIKRAPICETGCAVGEYRLVLPEPHEYDWTLGEPGDHSYLDGDFVYAVGPFMAKTEIAEDLIANFVWPSGNWLSYPAS